MFIYDINELAIIYDTLEFLNKEYNITVKDIPNAIDVQEVKSMINKVVQNLIDNSKNKSEIKKLNKYILK